MQSYLQEQRCSKKDRVFLPRVAESLTRRERWPRFRIICLLFTAALSVSHSARAQDLYGLLTGNITDSSGGAVRRSDTRSRDCRRTFFALFGRSATTPEYRPLGTTNYNPLQSSLKRRFAQGFQLGAAYTWSKTIGNTNSSVESTPAVQALAYFDKNRSVLSYDRTHVLNVTGLWELPFGRQKTWLDRGLISKIVGGWQMNGIFSAMSGLPFTVTASVTSLNMPGSTQFADQIKNQVEIIGGTGPNSAWFDPTAFAPVTQARLGTSGKNILRGPKLLNLDFGLFRDFSLKERVHLQFRGEAFNFTNTPHWGLPASNLSAVTYNRDGSISSLGGFGSITNTDASYLGRASMDERTFRFGLRLSF